LANSLARFRLVEEIKHNAIAHAETSFIPNRVCAPKRAAGWGSGKWASAEQDMVSNSEEREEKKTPEDQVLNTWTGTLPVKAGVKFWLLEYDIPSNVLRLNVRRGHLILG
jgi:hypothetical protein